MAEYCEGGRYAIHRIGWVPQNLYRQVSGKHLAWGGGFDGHIESVSKSTYGCDGILCPPDQLDRMISTLGYSPENIIMAAFDESLFQSQFDWAKTKGVTKFYLDEPVHNSKLPLLAAASVYATSIGCRVYTSESDGQESWLGLGSPSHVKFLSSFVKSMPVSQRPFVGCHTYFHMGLVLGADPRVQWTYLRQELGEFFNFEWLRLRSEQSSEETGLLFGHANNLGGIDRLIWGFWPVDPGWPWGVDHRLDDVSPYARLHGWLQRFEKERDDKWCCPTPVFDPELCDRESETYTGNERWV